MAATTMGDLTDARGGGKIHILEIALIENWWMLALRGGLAVLFGILALIFPGPTMWSLALIFAAFSLVDGVLAVAAAVRAIMRRERWGFMMTLGVVSLVAAALAFFWPGLTVLAFVLIVAAWSIVSGGLMLAAAFVAAAGHSRWWIGIYGALSVVFGVLIVIAPLAGAIVLTWWLGIYALLAGISLFVIAFALRTRGRGRVAAA